MTNQQTPNQSVKLRISFGGSHRKNARCFAALKPFLANTLTLPVSLGSKRLLGTVYDSPEMRETLKRIGGSICRKQPSYLKRVPVVETSVAVNSLAVPVPESGFPVANTGGAK